MTGAPPYLPGILALVGLALLAVSLRALARRARDRRHGALVGVDLPTSPGARLVSPRHRLVGRPDAIRERPDGRWVPVEVKSRTHPALGPPKSHRVQLEAYLLLVEATTGTAPPYGVLRYGDGVEFRLPWDSSARAELLELRRAVARPYDGRATPSPGRCRGCPWRRSCDRSVAPGVG